MRMKLKAVTRIILAMALANMLTTALDFTYATDELPIRNVITGLHYETIQDAIDASETLDGHTIQVEAGIYYERLTVNKSLKLIGEDRSTTIIDGGGSGTVINIRANDVDISGFTLRNSGPDFDDKGVNLDHSSHTIIRGNIIINNTWGIWLGDATANSITEDIIQNSTFSGIYLGDSTNNLIGHNTMANAAHGIWLERSDNNAIMENLVTENGLGISLAVDSNNNTVVSNVITNNDEAIHLFSSSNNINENTLTSNFYGIFSLHSGGNTIYRNNFIENVRQTSLDASYVDIWDNGFEGNYWGNYEGKDSNHDGIGDSTYEVYANNIDRYPLMGVFHSFNNSLGYNVNVISNSTIERLEYFETNDTIRIRLSQENTVDSVPTVEFCRVCIHHQLMDPDNIIVVIDDNHTAVLHPNYNLYDNTTHRWIYFAYQHPVHKADIVPEFPSLNSLPLFMMATLLVIIICRRKTKS